MNNAADGFIARRPANPGRPWALWPDALRDALALVVAAGVAAVVLGATSPGSSGATRLLTALALPTLLSPLVGRPGANHLAALPAHLLAWALGTLALAATIWIVAGGWPPSRSLAPTLVALGIVLTTRLAVIVAQAVLRGLGTALAVADEWARCLTAAALWLLAATPLWLGPLADLQSRASPTAAEAIVAASPLVHLGLAAGQDVLRTQWFYAHSSLGGLQFDYPSLGAVALAYVCIATLLALVAFGLARLDATRPPSTLPSSPT